MGQKKFILAGFIWLLLMGISCGCSRYSIPEVEKDEQNEDDVDSFTKAEEDSQLSFSFSHGAKEPNRNKEGDVQPFIYKGGEFSMKYTFSAEGKGKTVGFLLFVNGRPLPYKIDDNEEAEYCHIFSIRDNKDEDFTIRFTPRDGKKGEKIQILIDGIYHAGYSPNMKDTSGWGFYHSHLPQEYQMKLQADVPVETTASIPEHLIENVKMEKQKVNRKFLKEELPAQGYSEVTTEMLEQDFYYSITYDGQSNFDYLDVTDQKQVHVVYKICGRSRLRYSTTFFVNHQPVSDTLDVKLSKGGMAVIEADLDIEALKENSVFYVVTVPEDTGTYSESDIAISAAKSNSILLYQEENEQKEESTSVPTKEEGQGEDGLETIKGRISNIFYGNEGNLLIQTEKKLYLYNVEGKEVKAEMKIPDFGEYSVWRLDGGYAIVGTASKSGKQEEGMSVREGSSTEKWYVQLVDSLLNEGKKIHLSDLLSEKSDIFDCECIAVSHTGEKIAAVTGKGIMLCDVKSGKCWKLVDFKKKTVIDHFVLDGAEQLAFTGDDTRLAFLASVLPEEASEGDKSISAWGTISLADSEISMTADIEYYAEEMRAYDENMILTESFEHNSSRILKVDIRRGKKIFIPFSDQSEGRDGVYVSADGKYFATAYLSDHSVIVRVYDIEQGKLLVKKTIEDKIDDYFYRIPCVYLVDRARTCMVTLGSGIDELETKVEQFTF